MFIFYFVSQQFPTERPDPSPERSQPPFNEVVAATGSASFGYVPVSSQDGAAVDTSDSEISESDDDDLDDDDDLENSQGDDLETTRDPETEVAEDNETIIE